MKKEKSEWKLKLTKEQEEEVIKKWVMAMTKIIERLEEENDELRCRVEDLQPNYDNRYNLINREREDHQKVVNRLLVNNFILILAVVANFIVLLLK